MTVLPDKPGDARPDTCDPNLINPLRRVREAREAGLEPEIPALTPEEREFLLDRMGLDLYIVCCKEPSAAQRLPRLRKALTRPRNDKTGDQYYAVMRTVGQVPMFDYRNAAGVHPAALAFLFPR